MRAEQGQTNRLTRCLLEQFAHQHDVAQGLGHLGVVDIDEAVVHPVATELFAIVRAGALGDLVFVMREDQIVAAAVNVDAAAQMLGRHRRALDMPAGASATPGAVPAGQISVYDGFQSTKSPASSL